MLASQISRTSVSLLLAQTSLASLQSIQEARRMPNFSVAICFLTQLRLTPQNSRDGKVVKEKKEKIPSDIDWR